MDAPGPLPRFGAFVGERVLGRGATAEVWAARHAATGTPVAVKVVFEPGAFSRQEVRLAAGLLHPHVIRIHDLGRTDADQPFLVMERASGGRLRASVRRTWPEVRALLRALLEALAHLHANHLVHRDVKLGNLLVATPEDLRPGLKLADFGIATPTRERAQVAGSPQTMAPEQIRGEPKALGPWTDLYAVGVVAHQLVTGGLPWPARGSAALLEAHRAQAPAFLPPVVPVPDGFFELVGRLLRKDPAVRYQRAADVLAALDALDDTPGDGLPDEPTGSATFTFSREGPAPDITDEQAVEEPPPPAPRAPWPGWRPPPEAPQAGLPEVALRDVGAALVPDRRMPCVAREHERDRLWTELRAAATGRRPRVVLVTGPRGVGKSHLLGWLAARADELGLALAVTLDRSPRASMGDLAGLHLEGAPRATLTRWLRRFGPVDPGLVDDVVRALPSAEPNAGTWLRLAEHVSERRPVLIVADRVEDEPDVSAFVERALRTRPLVDGAWVLVVAVRQPPPVWRALADDEIALAALDPPDAARALGHLLPLAPGEADALLAEGGGLDEAVSLLRRRAAAGGWLPTAEGHVRRALPPAPWPPRVLEAVRWLAAFGGEVPAPVLAAATGDPAIGEGVGPWLRAGHLHLDRAEAAAVHAADPDAVRRRAAALGHWAALGDAVRQGDVFAVAGDLAGARERWVAAAEAGLSSGHLPRADMAVSRLRALGPDPLLGVLDANLARHRGRLEEAEALGRRALAEAAAAGDVGLEARAGIGLSVTLARQGRAAEAVAAAAHAESLGHPEQVLPARFYRFVHEGADIDTWSRAIDEAVASGASEAAVRFAVLRRATAATLAGDARARGWVDAARAALPADAPATHRASLLTISGRLWSAAGDPARARADHAEAAALLEQAGHPEAQIAWANLAELDLDAGDPDAASRRLEISAWFAARGALSPPLLAPLHVARAQVAVARGDLGAAAAELRAAEPHLPRAAEPERLLRRLAGLAAEPEPVGSVARALRDAAGGAGPGPPS